MIATKFMLTMFLDKFFIDIMIIMIINDHLHQCTIIIIIIKSPSPSSFPMISSFIEVGSSRRGGKVDLSKEIINSDCTIGRCLIVQSVCASYIVTFYDDRTLL